MIKTTLGCIATLWFTANGFGQIEISTETQESESPKSEEVKAPKSHYERSTTDFVLYANWSNTTRKLIENPANGGIYAEPLGTRVDETSLNCWSFGFAFKDRILPHLTWEGGISFIKNGESYAYNAPDSTYEYQTSYHYIGMPFKAYYTLGDKIQFFAGGGVVPELFVRYRQNIRIVDSNNTETTEEVETQNGYSTFVFSVAANVGVQASLGKRMSLLLMPEYRLQLSSSYVESADYAHYARAIGFNMGLTFNL